jgi:hypothetical protein
MFEQIGDAVIVFPASGDFRYNFCATSPANLKPAPLAQLDRASGYEPEGREFESLRAHHLFNLLSLRSSFWVNFNPYFR